MGKQLGKQLRTTRQEFFSICEELRNQQEQVHSTCHSYQDVVRLINQRMGLVITDSTAKDALEAVHITLTRQHVHKKNRSVSKALINAILHLYDKLGEEVIPELTEVCDRWQIALPRRNPDPPPANPIPAKTVMDPKTLRVVNQDK